MVDSDNHYLYLVQDGGKAIRYGITVGEEALAFSGIAKVGNMAEWPTWTSDRATFTSASKACRPSVPGGVDNPLAPARSISTQGNKDTLFRIHGTNQPEYIGASISSGCIRMTNEDVIDLYSRVKQGTVVVVLEPKHGDSPYNSKMALQGGGKRPDAAVTDAGYVAVERSRAPVLPALFRCRLLLARGFGLVRLLGVRFRGVRLCRLRIGLAASDLASSGLAATSRGGASSGRSAGNSGAICGSGSHTFHWQIR